MAIRPTDHIIIEREGLHYKAPVSQIPTGGGVSLVYGTATLDFGTYPGSNEAAVLFAAPSIPDGAKVQAFFSSDTATADHTANDHAYAALFISLTAESSAGVGGTIFARSQEKMQGQWSVRYNWVA